MRPIVITTHGNLASSLLATAEMIIGEASSARAVDFEIGSSVEELQRRVSTAVSEVAGTERVLFLVDLAGGSPSRVAATLALEGKADVLTGANLPMLIAALSDDEADIADITEAGRAGIDTYGVVARKSGGLL